MMNPKTTHAQDMSQRINIDVALFMLGKSAASIDEILPIAAAPAIHTDFKNTENKDFKIRKRQTGRPAVSPVTTIVKYLAVLKSCRFISFALPQD